MDDTHSDDLMPDDQALGAAPTDYTDDDGAEDEVESTEELAADEDKDDEETDEG